MTFNETWMILTCARPRAEPLPKANPNFNPFFLHLSNKFSNSGSFSILKFIILSPHFSTTYQLPVISAEAEIYNSIVII